jgi:hypothetical protein
MQGNHIRILKLRNPWGNTEWTGEGCESDRAFWSLIAPSEEKSHFLKDKTISNDGIFYILFKDYCRYFSQTHVCFMEEDGNYVFENFLPLKKRGSFWQCQIFEEDQYIFELHQESARGRHEEESALSRATILICKKNESKYELVSGAMSHYEDDTSLKVRLLPGSYVIFTKFDPSLATHKIPVDASLSVYSLHYSILDT